MAALSPVTQEVSVKGRIRLCPGWRMGDIVVITTGRVVKQAELFDAYWLEEHTLPDPRVVVSALRQLPDPPDLFTFTQRAPDTTPKFDLPMDWDNVAAIPVTTHEHWLAHQITAASRRNIRSSEKKGVTVRVSPFDEAYIRGIMSISDESLVRAGRRYWHYGKDFVRVQAEQGTYRHRSTYLGAYVADELVGYLKLVWDARTAAIMQIVSKFRFLDKRPNNALISEAVRLCAERGVGYLLYDKYVYGNGAETSLTRFKRENGFVRMDLPRYTAPLTHKGRAALALGLQRGLTARLPTWVTTRGRQAREWWYERRWPRPTPS